MIFGQWDAGSARKVRQFSLSAAFLAEYEGKQPAWDDLGYFTYKRTYARPTCACKDPNICGHPSEEYWQTVKRVVEGCFHIQKLHCYNFRLPWNETRSQRSAQDMYQRIWLFKFTPPGRGLWVMGTDQIYRKGGAALQSCGFSSTQDIDTDFSGPFTFLMDMSMLGVGVGGDMRGTGKARLQVPEMDTEPYVVMDDREGWVGIVGALLGSMVGKAKYPAVADYRQVRSRGTPILGFGGIASGAAPLVELMREITDILLPPGCVATVVEGPKWVFTTTITGEADPTKITSSQIADVFNLVGKCVVAGGIRRTAEILFGETDDEEFRNLKNPSGLIALVDYATEITREMNRKRKAGDEAGAGIAEHALVEVNKDIAKHPLNNHRWASNNSIFVKIGQDYTQVAKAIASNGEPGLMWLDNARQYSRMNGVRDDKDMWVLGANPCYAGDTLVAVADGRLAVPISVLAAEGNDVPLYALNSAGETNIRMGRNPRLTRKGAKLVRVWLDNGSHLDVTPDHKMIMRDGTDKMAQELVPGDALPKFRRVPDKISAKNPNEYVRLLVSATNDEETRWVYEHRMVAQHNQPEVWKETYNTAKQPGWHKGGLVVHHKDYDPLNNAPENLQIMAFRDHAALHAVDRSGPNNGMWGREHTAESKRKIGEKTRLRCQDPAYMEKLRASHTPEERLAFAKQMTAMRRERNTAYYLEQEATTDLKTYWQDGRLYGIRQCEVCGDDFSVGWARRGQPTCSTACGARTKAGVAARKTGQARVFAHKQQHTLAGQLAAYNDLRVQLCRRPDKKEWAAECKQQNVSYRIGQAGTTANPHALTSWRQVGELADSYNCRVVRVEHLEGTHDVYNISVDVDHNLALVTYQGEHPSAQVGVFAANCAEQSLESKELCNLVETFPAHHDSFDDYKKTLKMAYLYAKTVTLVPTHNPHVNAVMIRNRRIGCSMSGIQQAIEKLGRRRFLRWCDDGYNHIGELDNTYSRWLGVPRSVKMTSVKPSGTVSLLAGSTPGIHYAHSEYYIRNVRVASTSPLVAACRSAGYVVEVDTYAPDTMVVSFPIKTKNYGKGKRDASIWEQFANAAALQRHWADNQVSATITFSTQAQIKVQDVKGQFTWRTPGAMVDGDTICKDERGEPIVTRDERGDIAHCLEIYEDKLKSISLLPLSGHGYVQAPYIEIDEATYTAMAAKVTTLDLSGTQRDSEDKFCDGEACMI